MLNSPPSYLIRLQWRPSVRAIYAPLLELVRTPDTVAALAAIVRTTGGRIDCRCGPAGPRWLRCVVAGGGAGGSCRDEWSVPAAAGDGARAPAALSGDAVTGPGNGHVPVTGPLETQQRRALTS